MGLWGTCKFGWFPWGIEFNDCLALLLTFVELGAKIHIYENQQRRLNRSHLKILVSRRYGTVSGREQSAVRVFCDLVASLWFLWFRVTWLSRCHQSGPGHSNHIKDKAKFLPSCKLQPWREQKNIYHCTVYWSHLINTFHNLFYLFLCNSNPLK